MIWQSKRVACLTVGAAVCLATCGQDQDIFDLPFDFEEELAECRGRDYLPSEWEEAEQVVLTQAECDGDPYENYVVSVTASVNGGDVSVEYDKAHFRCAQDVGGFIRVRETDGQIDLLAQPKDMCPEAVAACSCLYNLEFQFDLASGEYEIHVYKRGDHFSDSDHPILPAEVGTVDLTVP
jgi:hypothetical protein